MKDQCNITSFVDELDHVDEILTEISNLGRRTVATPLLKKDYSCFVEDDDRVLMLASARHISALCKKGQLPSFELAGPRRDIYFDPAKTKCAVVTCGGLCPGINDVIRAIVMTLFYGYGVKPILGIKFGLRGFIPSYGLDVVELTPENVARIHEYGGTILGSSRGPQPAEEIVNALERMNVSILFTIGGDGTFRASKKIVDEINSRGLKIAVIAIPKTIDNDIFLVSKTFGFDTAVEMACTAIKSAHTEAIGAPNGVGLVKLMGRYSGFIAAAASIALREVNYCLIPEDDFDLEGEKGLLAELERRLERRGHAVIVVAEGAGQKYFADQPKETDPSGNVKLGDIGKLLKDRISEHFVSKGKEINVKYIDPSYIIRSVPANVDDSLYCGNLGQNAVHAAMAGKTDMMISLWNDRYVHIPLESATLRRKQVNLKSRFWMSVLESTGQPSLKNE
ncbi:MAG: ATP-dependent 6-phosphofructokinase [Thermodesulfobacteria bacterium]|nr:ATP-dependent 6-phosphofructokinase [Thermodesulfobacteriota bacterium]